MRIVLFIITMSLVGGHCSAAMAAKREDPVQVRTTSSTARTDTRKVLKKTVPFKPLPTDNRQKMNDSMSKVDP